jgi:hypothetical protein
VAAVYPRKDRNGRPLHAGDVVRIVGAPDLSSMSARARAKSAPVFAHLVGTYKRIASFDRFGHAQLNFSIARGPSKGWHGVSIEPFLLHLPRRMTER